MRNEPPARESEDRLIGIVAEKIRHLQAATMWVKNSKELLQWAQIQHRQAVLDMERLKGELAEHSRVLKGADDAELPCAESDRQ